MTEPQVREIRQAVIGTSGVVVQVAGDYYGRHDVLPMHPVPADERNVVANAFASTSTAERAFDVLKYNGAAIIVGEAGTGRRTSALRALLGNAGRPLYTLSADWEDDELLREERLVTLDGSGLLLELGSRRGSEETINVLLAYGDRLHEVGSALIITVDKSVWSETHPGQAKVVPALPPDSLEVVTKHLGIRGLRERIDWVKGSEQSRRLLGGKQTEVELPLGKLASQITPDDAVRLVGLIARAKDREKAEKDVPQQFKRWETDLEKFWDHNDDGSETRRDRALVLTVALLEGAPVEEIHLAWREFLGHAGEEQEKSTLAGSGFRPRLIRLNATVEGERVSFSGRPEYSGTVLRRVWRDWPDMRRTIQDWIKTVTAKGRVGSPYVKNIGHRLVDLSETVDRVPLTEIIKGWFKEHNRESSDMLTRAALNEPNGTEVRAKLLAWSRQEEVDPPKVVARVCAGSFAEQYPHHALVRLKWVLNRPKPDDATLEARKAIQRIAMIGYSERLRVLEALESWIAQDTSPLAGPRGFLALVDNDEESATTLRGIIDDVSRDPAGKDRVTRLWVAALSSQRLADETYEALISWASHAHAERIPQDTAMDILRKAIMQHTPTDAGVKFLYGSSADAEPLRWARQQLDLPGRCIHDPCPVCNPGNSSSTEHTVEDDDSSGPDVSSSFPI